jgi:hypothetical protein
MSILTAILFWLALLTVFVGAWLNSITLSLSALLAAIVITAFEAWRINDT